MAVALLFSLPVQADKSATKDDDALIVTGKGLFTGIMIVTDATNAVTVDIYDNTAASGTKMIPTWTVTTSSTNRVTTLCFDPGESYKKGIYVDVTCSGTVGYMVYYDPM